VVEVDVVVVPTASGAVVVVVTGVAFSPATRNAPNPSRAPRNKITRILEIRDMKAKIRPHPHQSLELFPQRRGRMGERFLRPQRAQRAAVPPETKSNGVLSRFCATVGCVFWVSGASFWLVLTTERSAADECLF
jgi:hypothetical protein